MQCRTFNIQGALSRFAVHLSAAVPASSGVLTDARAVACDGRHLYVLTKGLGLLKISIGQQGVAAGLVIRSCRHDIYLRNEARFVYSVCSRSRAAV